MTSFKVTPWDNANKLPLKYAIGTPLEFMLDEPDIEQCYLKGTELLTMSITIRQIGYDYSSDKKRIFEIIGLKGFAGKEIWTFLSRVV